MSGSEIHEVKKRLDAIQSEMKENTKLTREVLDRVGDRISKLEIAEATRQGRESNSKPDNVNWTKITLAILGVASAAISLALLLAQRVIT